MAPRTATLSLVVTLLACQCRAASLPIVRLGYAPHDHHAPLYVAAQAPEELCAAGRPYLRAVVPKEEYDLLWQDRPVARVRLSATPGGKELVRRLAEDQLDAALGGFPSIVKQIDAGSPLKILAPVMAGGSGLVVRPDFPARSWPEFVRAARASKVPVRIGYRAEFAVQKLLFERALAQEHLAVGSDIGDPSARVVLVNLYEGGNLIPALREGLVDGFVGVQPFLALAEEQKAGRLLSDLDALPGGLCAPGPRGAPCSLPCCALAVRDDLVRDQPEAVRALAALVAGASELIARNPEKAASCTSAWLHTPRAVEARSIPTIRFFPRRDAAWDAGAGRWVEAMVGGGVLKGAVARALRDGTLGRLLYVELPPGTAARP